MKKLIVLALLIVPLCLVAQQKNDQTKVTVERENIKAFLENDFD